MYAYDVLVARLQFLILIIHKELFIELFIFKSDAKLRQISRINFM